MSQGPLVSVIIPTWNSGAFLADTLESILTQTYRPIEVVLADDASSDDTVEISRAYARRHPDMFRVIPGLDRLGPCHQRNRALDAATGSLICWLDHDDLWLPTKLEDQVRLLGASPDVGLVFTGFESFDHISGRVLETSEHAREVDDDFLVSLFVRGCFVGSLTAMFRRSALAGPRPYLREDDFSVGDDYYLWLTIALNHKVAFIPRVLARYRRHDTNESVRVARVTNPNARLGDLQREFLTAHPEARHRLGSARRRGPARWYANAAIGELDSGGRMLTAMAYGVRALAMAPIQSAHFFARSAASACRNRVRARRARGA